MKIAKALLALGLAAATTVASGPAESALITSPLSGPSVSINGVQASLGSYITSGAFGGPSLNGQTVSTGRSVVQLNASGSSGPSISFSLSVSNLGSPNDYIVDIPVPLSPALTGKVVVQSTLGITQTGGTIAPTTGLGLPFIMTNTISAGFCDAGVDLANAPSNAITSNYSAGPITIDLSSPAFAGCSPATQLDVIIAFHGDGFDTYSLTGLFTVTPVPEPTTLALLASAFVGLGAARRRGATTS